MTTPTGTGKLSEWMAYYRNLNQPSKEVIVSQNITSDYLVKTGLHNVLLANDTKLSKIDL